MAKSMIFHNLKNLSKSVAAESDIIKANIDRVAVPLAGKDKLNFLCCISC